MRGKEGIPNLFEMWKYKRTESIGLLALVALVSCVDGRAGAKIITALIKELYKEYHFKAAAAKVNEIYCRTVLQRLRADGLVERTERGVWNISEQGKRFVDFISNKRKAPVIASREESNTIVIFDVPESDRMKRALLRCELRVRGFFALQKSVWLGKGPLDEGFIKFLKKNDLLPTVHIFSIARRGTV